MSNQGFLKGGWVIDPVITVDKLPEKLATGYYQAFENWEGASYKPLVYCGTQVVSGTNHMFICEQTLVTNPPMKHIAKVILHETLPAEGKLYGDFSIMLIETIA